MAPPHTKPVRKKLTFLEQSFQLQLFGSGMVKEPGEEADGETSMPEEVPQSPSPWKWWLLSLLSFHNLPGRRSREEQPFPHFIFCLLRDTTGGASLTEEKHKCLVPTTHTHTHTPSSHNFWGNGVTNSRVESLPWISLIFELSGLQSTLWC